MKLFSGNAVWQLISQADFVTKIVLGILLIMSVICWALFFYKIIMLKLKQRQMQGALAYLKKVQSFDDVRLMAAAFIDTLPGYFLNTNLGYLQSTLQLLQGRDQKRKEALELVEHKIDQTIDEIVVNEELYLPVLASCAAVAPLLGLFGTVWGLVHAFLDISQKQTADITVVAPGIAEALITTLVGLVVAIPALLMFHYLNSQISKVERQIEHVSDRYLWHVQKVLLD